MFATSFQKGDRGVEIFSPSGTDPLKHIALKNEDAIEKVYDRYVKGNILTLDQTSVSSSMSCPRSSSKLLGIIQPWFCLQLNIPSGKSFSLELIVTEQNGRHHRIHFSTNFKGWDANELHARISWPRVHEDLWVTYILNLDELCRTCFRSSFQSLDHFTVFSCCRMRKIFSLPARMTVADIIIPPNLDFPVGVAAEIYLVSLPERVEKSSASINHNVTGKNNMNKTKKAVATAEIGIIGTKKALTTAPGTMNTHVNTGKDIKPRLPLSSKPGKLLPVSLEMQTTDIKNIINTDTTNNTRNNIEGDFTRNVKQDTLESIIEFNDDNDDDETDHNNNDSSIFSNNHRFFETHNTTENEYMAKSKNNNDAKEIDSNNAQVGSNSVQRLSCSSENKDHRHKNPSFPAKDPTCLLRHSGFSAKEGESWRYSTAKTTEKEDDNTDYYNKYNNNTNDQKITMKNFDSLYLNTQEATSLPATSPAKEDPAEDLEETRKLKHLLEDRNPWQTTSPVKNESLVHSRTSLTQHTTSRPTSSALKNTYEEKDEEEEEEEEAFLNKARDKDDDDYVNNKNYNHSDKQNTNSLNNSVELAEEQEGHDSEWFRHLSASKQALSALLSPPLYTHNNDNNNVLVHSNDMFVTNNTNIAYISNNKTNNNTNNGVMSSVELKQQLLHRKAPVEPVDTKVFTNIQQWQKSIALLSEKFNDNSNNNDSHSNSDMKRPGTLVPLLCDKLQQLECAFWQSFGREEYEDDIGYFEFDT